jgi:hypothetical protein
VTEILAMTNISTTQNELNIEEIIGIEAPVGTAITFAMTYLTAVSQSKQSVSASYSLILIRNSSIRYSKD